MKKLFFCLLPFAFSLSHAQAPNPNVVLFNDGPSLGISPVKQYTHALDFGNYSPAYATNTVLGVDFLRTRSDFGTYHAKFDNGKYPWSGFPKSAHNGGGTGVRTPSTEPIHSLLTQFFFADAPNLNYEITLSGLAEGASYEVALGFCSWVDAPNTEFVFTDAGGASAPFTLNLRTQDSPAQHDRLLVYRYKAAQGGKLTINTKTIAGGGNRGLFIWFLTNELLDGFILNPATGVTKTNALLSAKLNGAAATKVTAFWALNDGGEIETNWTGDPSHGTLEATDAGNGVWTAEAAPLLPDKKYYVRFKAVLQGGGEVWTGAGTFFTKSDRPEITMLQPVDRAFEASVITRLDSTGGEPEAGILLFCGKTNHEANLGAWLGDGGAIRVVREHCGPGAHTNNVPYPSLNIPVYCRAFAFNSHGTNAAPAGITLNSLFQQTTTLAKEWIWTGRGSVNWSDTNNWVHYATNAATNDIAALRGKNLLLTTGVRPPSNQDIEGLVVKELQAALLTNSITVHGQPVTLGRFCGGLNLANPVELALHPDITVEASGGAWEFPNTLVPRLHGALMETGGSKRMAVGGGGSLRLHGDVFTTGGFQGNFQFHGMKTTGLLPAAPMPHYFSAANTSLSFNHPAAGVTDTEYYFPLAKGMAAGSGVDTPQGVTALFTAPIAANGGGGIEKGNSAGILELNAPYHDFTGRIFMYNGLVILKGGIRPVGNMELYFGSIDLNGQNLVDWTLKGYNSGGHHADGVYRNQNPDQRSILNGKTLGLGSYQHVHFGGVGDILYTGDIETTADNHRFYKVGGGTLTLTGTALGQHVSDTGFYGSGTVFDYRENNTPKVSETASMILSTKLTLLGNADADTTQTIGPLQIGGAGSDWVYQCVRITPVGGGVDKTATFRFGALSLHGEHWNTGAVCDFAPGERGFIRTSQTANWATINALPPRLTWKGSSFARVSQTDVVNGYHAIEPLGDADYLAGLDDPSLTLHSFVDLAGDVTNATYRNVGAVRFNAPATLTLERGLRFAGEETFYYQGAMLVTPNVGDGGVVINGPAALCENSGDCGFTIHQYNTNAALVINARIYNGISTGLTKTGPGELVLTHPGNSFTRFNILEGVVSFYETGVGHLPSPIGQYPTGGHRDILAIGDATLRYIGTNAAGHATCRQFRARGKAVVEAGGAGPLAFTNAIPVLSGAAGNQLLTLSGTGRGIITGTLNQLNGGRLRKRGSGTWTLAETSHSPAIVWGADVMEGTLVLNGTLGRDVRVFKGGALTGSGKVQRDLYVHDNGVIAISPNPQISTSLNPPLTVGMNLFLEPGAKLDLPRKLPADWTTVIEILGGEIHGAFTAPPHAYVRYDNGVQIKQRPVGTLLMVR